MKKDFQEYYRASPNAEKKLSGELGLYWDNTIQDWDLINSNPNLIADFHMKYKELKDDDEKFVLMQLIVASFAGYQSKKDFDYALWSQCSIILEKEHFLHIHTINYWLLRNERGLQVLLSSLMNQIYQKVVYHYE